MIFRNLERNRLIHEFLTLFSKLQQAIILNVFRQVTGNLSLTDHRIPCLFVFILSRRKDFQFVVFE